MYILLIQRKGGRGAEVGGIQIMYEDLGEMEKKNTKYKNDCYLRAFLSTNLE